MEQKKIYTLPQAFFDDPNVAVKWKLFAVLNGFWVNGLTVYAANKFFADKTGVSERAIQSALGELEAMGLIRREIHGHNRTIYPAGAVKEEDEAQLRAPRSPASSAHEAQHPPNASSIALNKVTAVADFEIKYINEDTDSFEVSPKQRRIEKRVKDAYDAMIKWSEVQRGFPFLTTERTKQYKAFKIAKENGLKSVQLKERFIEMLEDDFWKRNGFDWMNVVTSFNKRPATSDV